MPLPPFQHHKGAHHAVALVSPPSASAPRLTALNLSGIDAAQGGQDLTAVEALEEALRENKVLTRLDLSRNPGIPQRLLHDIEGHLKVNRALLYADDTSGAFMALCAGDTPQAAPPRRYELTLETDEGFLRRSLADQYVKIRRAVVDEDGEGWAFDEMVRR